MHPEIRRSFKLEISVSFSQKLNATNELFYIFFILKERLCAKNGFHPLLINIYHLVLVLEANFSLLIVNLWGEVIWNACEKSLVAFNFIFIMWSSIIRCALADYWSCFLYYIVSPPPPIADCQKPKATETFILSKAALLSNYFPEGGHEVLECAHGYNRVKGSGTTVCTNGQWSDPDLICEGKPPDCRQ